MCLHPRQSYVQNIGFDGSGENCGVSHDKIINDWRGPHDKQLIFPLNIKENLEALSIYKACISNRNHDNTKQRTGLRRIFKRNFNI